MINQLCIIMKRSGPIIELCGTPVVIGKVFGVENCGIPVVTGRGSDIGKWSNAYCFLLQI